MNVKVTHYDQVERVYRHTDFATEEHITLQIIANGVHVATAVIWATMSTGWPTYRS